MIKTKKETVNEEGLTEENLEYLDSIRNTRSWMYYDLTLHKKVLKGIRGKILKN